MLNDFYRKQDKINFFAIFFTFISVVLLTGFFLINRPNLPDKLPLQYSLAWGEPQLAESSQFIILPLIVLLITLVNSIIAWHLHPSQLILKRIINLSTFLMAYLILITGVRIIFIYI